MTGLKDKSVVITGAGGGLGRATAELLSKEGALLAITDLDWNSVNETAEIVRGLGGAVVATAGDGAHLSTADAVVQAAETAYGGIGGVCNVAGINGVGMLEDISIDLFTRVMQTNCLSQILTTQRALPALRRAKAASVVNVASVGALIGLPYLSVYCASKSAILGLTRALALELAPHIRCNAICPGGIDTPMSRTLLAQFEEAEQVALREKLIGRQLLKRFAEAHEIARSIIFLLSDEAAFVTGAVLAADGGATAW
jgi:meso-butanediol dehydrogenase/(S,S)-butanediol dehydrogenase/diacetyl reductase